MTPPAAAPPLAEAAELEPLRAELDVLKAERDKFREQLLRTAADFDNFRKRSKRDLDDARERSKGDLVRDLLPVFDNLERAVSSSTPSSDVKSVVDGIRMVLKLFEDSAERLGLVRIKSVGERFDPAQHEAIQQLETDEHVGRARAEHFAHAPLGLVGVRDIRSDSKLAHSGLSIQTDDGRLARNPNRW